ncbi:MAG: hypothetical protein AAGH89_05550 [Verrucomicrobiota bacterium]
MNAVEQILYNALQENPDDWSVRFELLGKLQASGSAGEVVQVISEATSAPASDSELQHLVHLATEAGQPECTEPILSAVVAQKPSGAVGHQLLAKVLVKTGNIDQAREHYNTAVALNPEMTDDILAVKLADLGETLPQPAGQAEQVIAELAVPEAVAEPEVAAIIPPPAIASPLTPPPGKGIPTPVPVEPEVEEPAAADSTLAAIPAVEADVAPPTNPLKPVPDLKETAAHMVTPEEFDSHAHLVEQDGAEAVEFEDHLHQTRHLMVAEAGAVVKAMEKTGDKNQKMSSVVIAVVAHVVLALLFGLVAMNLPQEQPPQIVASAAQVLDQDTMQKQELQKQVQRKPVQSASNQMEVISVAGASSVAMPDIQTDLVSFDPIGMGDAFGASMSFDAGEDGGMVSFFGSKSTSKKVVFVVDYSASMKSQDKHVLMRKELAKSLNALPGGISYQCIFFSGPVWYAGQGVKRKSNEDMTVKAERGNDEWRWMGKGATNWWMENNQDGDPDKLPKAEFISSTRSNIRKSIKHVEETDLVYGTDWRSPLYMAMNMEPDTIFFMTDGAYGGKQNVLDDLIKHNNRKGRAKINTICLMVPQAMEKLTYLAEKSRGEVSLVLADQTVLRGKELEDYTKKGK